MKILLTGRNGQVGWELHRCLLPVGQVIALDHTEADYAKPDQWRDVVRRIKPDVIVNAAAYTAVDQAETERELACILNAKLPEVLAEEAKQLGALFVHYSTEYVFDGKKPAPYTEEDIPKPLNVYGRTKLEGEQAVEAVGGDYLLFRTSWVYAARGRNFLRTILRLAGEREELRIVNDQIGAPTWARLIASVTAHCLRQSLAEKQHHAFVSGLYHLASSGETSWYEFARAIIDLSRSRFSDHFCVQTLESIPTADFPTAAERPLNSRLVTDRLQGHFNLTLPDWNVCLGLCLAEWGCPTSPIRSVI